MRAPDRGAVLSALAAFPDRLLAVAVTVATADAAAGGPPAGEWSALENVAHLVAVERAVWQARLDELANAPAGEEPVWGWVEPGPTGDPEAATLDGALGLFARERSTTVARVTALDDAGWARAGIHAVYGRLDVAALLGVAADHDTEHLASMQQGRSAT